MVLYVVTRRILSGEDTFGSIAGVLPLMRETRHAATPVAPTMDAHDDGLPGSSAG